MEGTQRLRDACRDALRIPAGCTDYDGEIDDLIDSARSALRAGGVRAEKAADDSDGTIRLAIKVWCKANFGMDNPDHERFMQSFETLVTQMHGSVEYRSEP